MTHSVRFVAPTHGPAGGWREMGREHAGRGGISGRSGHRSKAGKALMHVVR
jgi:hypothetical protein